MFIFLYIAEVLNIMFFRVLWFFYVFSLNYSFHVKYRLFLSSNQIFYNKHEIRVLDHDDLIILSFVLPPHSKNHEKLAIPFCLLHAIFIITFLEHRQLLDL